MYNFPTADPLNLLRIKTRSVHHLIEERGLGSYWRGIIGCRMVVIRSRDGEITTGPIAPFPSAHELYRKSVDVSCSDDSDFIYRQNCALQVRIYSTNVLYFQVLCVSPYSRYHIIISVVYCFVSIIIRRV